MGIKESVRNMARDAVLDACELGTEDIVKMIGMVADVYAAVKSSDKAAVIGEIFGDIGRMFAKNDTESVDRDIEAIRKYMDLGLSVDQAMHMRLNSKALRNQGLDSFLSKMADRLVKQAVK